MLVDEDSGWCEHASIQLLYASFLVKYLSLQNKKCKLAEPGKGLVTQGMVCHETYKDENNNWISPDEIEVINGKKVRKKNPSMKIKIGHS